MRLLKTACHMPTENFHILTIELLDKFFFTDKISNLICRQEMPHKDVVLRNTVIPETLNSPGFLRDTETPKYLPPLNLAF
jgi:hypothetical protein